jgi:hypothetical protein
MKTTPPSLRLGDLPLWRLLVALADAERTLGPSDPTTRQFADAVRSRLADPESASAYDPTEKGMSDGN